MATEGMMFDNLSTNSRSSARQPGSTNDALRAKKLAEAHARTIRNRINYFKREETKIWRDLEEVRRQTGKIEDGRTRATEKKLADHTILQQKESTYYLKRLKTVELKNERDLAKQKEDEALISRKEYGKDRRRESQQMLEQKRLVTQQTRLRNSERAMRVQRSQLDAKMRANEDKQNRLAAVRQETAQARVNAAKEVETIESIIPALEEEEMACLQRLQNSRIVTQNVLQELEASLGRQSSVSSVMRLRGSSMRSSFAPPERSSMAALTEENNEEEGVDREMTQTNGGQDHSAMPVSYMDK